MLPVRKRILPPTQRLIQATLMLAGRSSPTFWERWYWRKPDHQRALDCLLQSSPDLIHVNEAIALPIAIEAAATLGTKVLFDAHEYSPGNRSDLLWRIFAGPLHSHLIRAYAPKTDRMITVAYGIAQRYAQELGIDVDVIMNTPAYRQHPFRQTDPDRIGLVHHGAAIPERKLETMIDVIALTDARYTLDFMLVNSSDGYIERLITLSRKLAPGRVSFRPPVPPEHITEAISNYDIGLFLLPPANFSYANALPNKFFEFMMAGLAVAIGPSPEMARICTESKIGLVSEDFAPVRLAEKLNKLTNSQIDTMKRNSLSAAKVYNADREMRKLLGIYDDVLHNR